jgi:hypothetical protein
MAITRRCQTIAICGILVGKAKDGPGPTSVGGLFWVRRPCAFETLVHSAKRIPFHCPRQPPHLRALSHEQRHLRSPRRRHRHCCRNRFGLSPSRWPRNPAPHSLYPALLLFAPLPAFSRRGMACRVRLWCYSSIFFSVASPPLR